MLGACLLWPDAIDNAASFIEAHHFFEPIHSQIFEWVLDLRARGQRPSAPLLNAYLSSLGQIDIAGLPLGTYVARLAAEATTILNIPDFAKVVREFWQRRQIKTVLETGLELVRAAPIEILAEQISAETIEQLDAIASSQIPASVRALMGVFAKRVVIWIFVSGRVKGSPILAYAASGVRCFGVRGKQGRQSLINSRSCSATAAKCPSGAPFFGHFAPKPP